MSSPSMNLQLEQLASILQKKTALYNQMIDDNKEFDDVKGLFLEIKQIVAALSQLQESQMPPGTLQDLHRTSKT